MAVREVNVDDGSYAISATPVIALTLTDETPEILIIFCSTDCEQLEQSMPVTIRRIVDNVDGLESWVVMADENDEGHRVRMDEKVLRNWLKQHETEQHDFEHSHFTLLEFQHISQQIANNRRASTIGVFVGMTSTLDEQNVSPPEPWSWL